ncbi:MAG: hypothetical protein ACTHLW_17590 [Verrucomicrobiota bacterium]
MFFFEWVIPLLAVIAIGVFLLYFSLRNRAGAGIRTDGKTLADTPTDKESKTD